MSEIRAKKGWREGLDDLLIMVPPDLEFDPRKTALLVVDMQYCDAHRHYGLGKRLTVVGKPERAKYYFDRLENVVVPNHVKLLQFFRQHGLRIIFVAIGSQVPDYADLAPYRKRREKESKESTGYGIVYYRGDFEYQLLPELNRREEEPIILKVSSGAFNSTGIDHLLRNMGIDGLVISGVATNACVETTARDAADRGYKCILVDDACATFDEESHVATLRSFARLYGYVKTTDEVIEEFTAKLAGKS